MDVFRRYLRGSIDRMWIVNVLGWGGRYFLDIFVIYYLIVFLFFIVLVINKGMKVVI